jgi:hypothetical protein
MAQVLQAQDTSFRVLIENFDLEFVDEPEFFPEWQTNLPELTDETKASLDNIRKGFLNLVTYPPLLEKTIQIVVVGPLFYLAGFYMPPFHIKAETSVAIAVEDEGTVIRDQIDILLFKENLWTLGIDSKQATFSAEEGLGQLLAYMLANPVQSKPGFGLITSGSEFLFIKLDYGTIPRYGTSRLFGMRSRGDIYEVYQVLKHISQI